MLISEKFRRAVFADGQHAGIAAEHLENALTWEADESSPTIRGVLARARRIQDTAQAPPGAQTVVEADATPDSGTAQRARQLERVIAPWVIRLREEYFGVPGAPFSGPARVAEWMATQAYGPLTRTPRDRADYRRACALLGQIARRSGQHPAPVAFPMPVRVDYVTGSGRGVEDAVVWVRVDTPAARLAMEVERLANGTGVRAADLMHHVLTGARLRLQRVRGTVSEAMVRDPESGVVLRRRWATIQFAGVWALTEFKAREVVRGLRDDLHLRKQRALSARDQALWALTQKMPRRPDEGEAVYFRRLKGAWKRDPHGMHFESEWHMKQAVVRLAPRVALSA